MRHTWVKPSELGYKNLGDYTSSCHLCGIIKNDKNAEADNCCGLVKVKLR